jgi:hypothetical protein
MPRIITIYGIAICIYYGDHNPPHFHARAGDAEARIVIDTLVVLTSNLPNGQLHDVIAWASNNQDVLRAAWARCNP